MNIKIDKEFKSIIPKLTAEEYAELEQSIIKEGCRDAICLWKEGENDYIVDGHNRYEICNKHSSIVNDIPFEVKWIELEDRNSVLTWMMKNQLGRRNLTAEQKSFFIGKLYNEQKKQGSRSDLTLDHFDLKLNTAQKISKEQKVSEPTVKRAGKYVNELEEIDELDDTFSTAILNQDIKATKNEVQQLAKRVKEDKPMAQKILNKIKEESKSISQATREVVNDSMDKQEIPISDKKYQVIYADPPWKYDTAVPQKYGDAEKHYMTMSVEDICKMKVPADSNCVLFLWVTSPKLIEGIKVMQAWGFEYKTSFVWDKVKHNVGYYNSVRHEFLLIGGRGKSTPTMENKKLHDSVISIERSDKHSEKPEEFRKLIETLYPNTQKIELFARVKADGWDVFGNQVGE